MARKVEDIELDIAEVKTLIFTVKREANQVALAKHLSALKSELEAATPKVEEPVKAEETARVEVAGEGKSIVWTPLKKYSWDQEGRKVKIYISLDNIGNEVPASQIDIRFEKQALEVRVLGYRKNNYLLGFKKLCGPIDPDTCKYLIKTNMISITLSKKEDKKWGQLEFKEDTFSKQDSKQEDPQAGLMNMMKKMYEEGDDNMKRTIAEAWTKSREGKGSAGMPDMGL